MRENEPVLLILSVCDGEIILEKGEILCEKCQDGVEMTFAVNYLAPFLLTNLLLDMLKASAPARIVNVSSAAHTSGSMRMDDLQAEKLYRPMRTYPQAKLAVVLFTYELARRLQGTGVTANCLHPGFVATNFAQSDGGPAVRLLVKLIGSFGASP